MATESSKIGSGRVQVDEKSNRISIAGTSTEMEWEKIVEATEKYERRPADRLQTKVDSNKLTMAALNECRAKVDLIRGMTEQVYKTSALDKENYIFDAKTVRVTSQDPVDSSNPRILVSVKNSASLGSYTMQVSSLAKQYKITSLPIVGILRDEPANFEGSLILWAPHHRDKTFEMVVEPQDSLSRIVAGLNELEAGITCKLISPKARDHRIIMQAQSTGEDHRFAFLWWSTPELLESQLKLARPGNETLDTFMPLQVSQEASDAEFVFDGIIAKSPSNIVQDLVEGLTIQILRTHDQHESVIAIEPDLPKMGQFIDNLVNAYNDLVVFLNTQTEFDSLTRKPKEGAHLYGNQLVGDLRRILSTFFNGLGHLSSDEQGLRGNPIRLRIGPEHQGTLQMGTAEVDWMQIENILVKNLAGFKNALTFQFQADDQDLAVVDFGAETREPELTRTTEGNITTLMRKPFQLYVELDAANRINGSASQWSDGDIVVDRFNPKLITIASGAAKGLKMVYAGGRNATQIEVEYTLGAMTPIHFALERVLERENGTMALGIQKVEAQITRDTERAKIINERVTKHKDSMVKKFSDMERKLGLAEKARVVLEQANEAWINSRR